MRQWLGRPLDDLDLRVVMIDGKIFRKHCLLIALGLDSEGRKHVLGLREGATEPATLGSKFNSGRDIPVSRDAVVPPSQPGCRRARPNVEFVFDVWLTCEKSEELHVGKVRGPDYDSGFIEMIWETT